MIAESKTEEKDVMVKVVVNLINQWTFRSPAEGKGKRIRADKAITPQKAFEVGRIYNSTIYHLQFSIMSFWA